MADSDNGGKQSVRRVAQGLALLWAFGWVVLGAVFGTAGLEGGERIVGAIVQGLIPGAVFVAAALASLKWPMWGGVALLALGALTGFGYPLWATNQPASSVVFIELTMALPPLVAGALLILSARPRPPLDAPPPVGDLP